MIKAIAIKLWAYFAFNLKAMIAFFSVYHHMMISVGLTGLWYNFRIAFERDHNISFNVSWPILALVLADILVQVVGCFKNAKKADGSPYLLKTTMEDFMTKFILYWIFIKVVDWICFKEYMGFVGDSLLFGVMIHQALVIRDTIKVIMPGLLPKWISALNYDQLVKMLKK